jgi:hypothetical protein
VSQLTVATTGVLASSEGCRAKDITDLSTHKDYRPGSAWGAHAACSVQDSSAGPELLESWAPVNMHSAEPPRPLTHEGCEEHAHMEEPGQACTTAGG